MLNLCCLPPHDIEQNKILSLLAHVSLLHLPLWPLICPNVVVQRPSGGSLSRLHKRRPLEIKFSRRKSTKAGFGRWDTTPRVPSAAPATLCASRTTRVSLSLGYANWRKSGPGIEWVTWAAWRAAAGMEIGRSLQLWVWRGPTAHLLFFRYKHPHFGVPFGARHRDRPELQRESGFAQWLSASAGLQRWRRRISVRKRVCNSIGQSALGPLLNAPSRTVPAKLTPCGFQF